MQAPPEKIPAALFSALLIIKELTKAMLYIIFKSADVDPKS